MANHKCSGLRLNNAARLVRHNENVINALVHGGNAEIIRDVVVQDGGVHGTIPFVYGTANTLNKGLNCGPSGMEDAYPQAPRDREVVIWRVAWSCWPGCYAHSGGTGMW